MFNLKVIEKNLFYVDTNTNIYFALNSEENFTILSAFKESKGTKAILPKKETKNNETHEYTITYEKVKDILEITDSRKAGLKMKVNFDKIFELVEASQTVKKDRFIIS